MQELKTGQKLIERGEMDGAITLFKSLSLSGSPETTAEALHALGVALFQKHPSAATAKEALSYIDKALSQQPQNARFHNSRGIILEKTGNKESALESFRSAVELAPRSTKFLVNLAKLHKSQNDFIEALRYMQLVADIDPKVRALVMCMLFINRCLKIWKWRIMKRHQVLQKCTILCP